MAVVIDVGSVTWPDDFRQLNKPRISKLLRKPEQVSELRRGPAGNDITNVDYTNENLAERRDFLSQRLEMT